MWKHWPNSFPISIHALRVEGDGGDAVKTKKELCISIHALRVEGDMAAWIRLWPTNNFYPRPPCGGRRIDWDKVKSDGIISIHALRVEGDQARKIQGSVG